MSSAGIAPAFCLPKLSYDERAALAFLMKLQFKYGEERIWPKRHSISRAIHKSHRTASRVMTVLVAAGAIERLERGPAASRYRILWDIQRVRAEIGAAFGAALRENGSAFDRTNPTTSKSRKRKHVKYKNAAPNGSQNGAALLLYAPPNPPLELGEDAASQRSETTDQAREDEMKLPIVDSTGNTMSKIPEYYRDPASQKLWRMAQCWIAKNNPDLSGVSGDKARPIMYALEAAGALNLPEDSLPMITWPSVEATPLLKLAEAVERKPIRSLTREDYEFLKRKIGK